MEESYFRRRHYSLQWSRRHCWELHCETERGTEVYDRDLDQHRISHLNYLHCCRVLSILLVCEWKADEGQEVT
jgi:hypothetical protein